ncbi:MAG: GreA/GreB family elongation factor [Bacteroidetes bacterium]|nr:GreA/GreB family elongation factor [Bacteroidota bacterium]
MKEWKKEIQEACQHWLSDKLHHIEDALYQARQGIESEEKSSAGDKYETGRAMGHLEQERLSRQLKEIKFMQSSLNSLMMQPVTDRVVPGTLIRCAEIWVFIVVGIGKISIQNSEVWVISAASPIGKSMLGKRKGDMVNLNGKLKVIEELL